MFINCYVHSERLWEFFLVQILADKLGPYYVTLTIKLSIFDVTSLQNKAMFISYVAWQAPFCLLQIVSKVCEVTDQVTMIASWHFQVIYFVKVSEKVKYTWFVNSHLKTCRVAQRCLTLDRSWQN